MLFRLRGIEKNSSHFWHRCKSGAAVGFGAIKKALKIEKESFT